MLSANYQIFYLHQTIIVRIYKKKKKNVKIKKKEKEDTYKTQIINRQTMPRTQL